LFKNAGAALIAFHDPFWIIRDDPKWVKNFLAWLQSNRCEPPAGF
jgi:hypothetical protein